MNNWSTPSAHDGRRPGADDTSTQGRNLKREAEGFLADAEHSIGGGNLKSTPKHTGGIDLEGAVELWQTPNVPNGGRVNPPGMSDTGIMPDGSKRQVGLEDQVRRLARREFPTPAARDYRSESGGAATMSHFNRPSGPSLPAMIEHSFRPAPQTETFGKKSSLSAQTSPRRLNPKFVEWLQGLPEGWTSREPINSEVLEIWLCHCREHLRSLCF